jgi:signal transduction histidine kinase
MLDDFVVVNREAILLRIQRLGAPFVDATDLNPLGPIPLFLAQLCAALRAARESVGIDHTEIFSTAAQLGTDIHRQGTAIGQVVQRYGDVREAISWVIAEQGTTVTTQELRTFDSCLNDAIDGAVTAFAQAQERKITADGTERLGALSHDLRNLLSAATLSYQLITSGRVAAGGNTALVLGRSLLGLRKLLDRSLAETRLDSEINRTELTSAADLAEEVQLPAALQAEARRIGFSVLPADRAVTILCDRQTVAAAISNLLENAFKFTRPGGQVSLRVIPTDTRVLFEIEDQCGGLPAEKAESLLRSLEHSSTDPSGLGLGLRICLKAAKASAGEIHVRDLPTKGCVFTLDLPRQAPPPLKLVAHNTNEADRGVTISSVPKRAAR